MKNKALRIIVSVLCAITLTFLGVMGLYFGIRNARAVVKLDDIILDSGTVTYLASVYKMDYEGEDFDTDFADFLKERVANAYLYTIHFGYTPEDKIIVSGRSEKVLMEMAHGSVSEFNDLAEDLGYGFDYNDFQNANALNYKADKAKELMPTKFGADEYERMLVETMERVDFGGFYSFMDFSEIPTHDYYVK